MQTLLALPQNGKFAELLARDWSSDIFDFARHDLPKLIFILIVTFLLLRSISFLAHRMRRIASRATTTPQRSSQLNTLASVTRATGYGVVSFLAILQILPIFNINLGPLLASAGVAGVAIGFGAQTLVKDVLNGMFILIEDQFSIGDQIKAAGLSGKVEEMTLRRTLLRDGDGTLHIIPNSQISIVSNQSRDWIVAQVNVSVDYSANPDTVIELLRTVAFGLRSDDAFKDAILTDPDVLGVDKINGPEVIYPIVMRTRPTQQWSVMRELRKRIKLALEKSGIPAANLSSSYVVKLSPASTVEEAAQESTAPASLTED
ncbi:MAG: mechanosensitive ion channel family protein [Acidobacteriaceae bacterium]